MEISKYHGAEHMTINAYTNDIELSKINIKNQSRIADSCGINAYLFFVIYLIPNIFFVHSGFWSLVYCCLLTSIYFFRNMISDMLIYPIVLLGRYVQKYLSTRDPDDKHIELAIVGIEKLLAMQEKLEA